MKRLSTTVTYRVPVGLYCNLREERHRGWPVTERCRFCTQVGTNTFTCVLYNAPLVVEGGYLIQKSKECKRALALGRSESDTSQDGKAAREPTTQRVDPKALQEWVVKEFLRRYRELLADGYPPDFAMRIVEADMLGKKVKL